MMSNSTISPVEPIVKLSGDIDITCGPELSRLAKRLVDSDAIIIDVSDVDYVDTTFLRFLLRLRRYATKTDRAAIKVVGVKQRLKRIFEITGFMRLFDVECAEQLRL